MIDLWLIKHRLRRLALRWRLWKDSAEHLNRRAAVEQHLFDAAQGKKPLPDAEKCRELALKLGIGKVVAPTPAPAPAPAKQSEGDNIVPIRGSRG